MACTYNSIIRQAALKVNAIVGATVATIASNYGTTPLTSGQFQSVDFPINFFLDTCILVEEKLANRIAFNREHPWRASLYSFTAIIPNFGLIPTTDSFLKPIIGVMGAVHDSTSGVICQEKPIDVIRRRVRNANDYFKTDVYYYAYDGIRVTHTRANVQIDCCVYDRAARRTAIDTLTNPILLPDTLEEAYVNGMVSMLIRDDEFIQQAAIHRGYFEQTLQDILPDGQIRQAA